MDDIELAALTKPALTTIRVPTKEIGVLAARRIVGLIEKRTFDDPLSVKCDVILRESLGDAPATSKRIAAVRKSRR
jgi:LacI family transcriptional regulator